MPDFTDILILAFLVLGAVGLYRLSRRLSDVQRQLVALEAQIKLHQQSILGLTSGAVGVDKRIRGLEAGEQALAARQDTLENQQLPDDIPYSQAIRMVQQGATAARLVDELGLSESEARLIQELHGGKVTE